MEQFKNIKTLIFDFGGVLINLDLAACIRKINELGISNVEQYLSNYGQAGFFLKFEKGEAIENDLYRLLSKWLINHIQHDDQDYVDAVRDNMLSYLRKQEQKKGKGWFARFFS